MNETKNTASTISLVCGIIGLIVSIVMGILFGVIGAGIGIALGIVAIIFGIKAKKETDGSKGTGGFVCGILAVVFAVIFAVGCTLCGTGSTKYACYGCVGGPCMAGSHISNMSEGEIDDAMNELSDAFKEGLREGLENN